MLTELLPDLEQLGYKLEPFGNNTFVVQGTPADVGQASEKNAIEKLIEQYKHFSNDLKFSKREKLLRSLSLQQSIKAGTSLSEKEMKNLMEELFACETPNATPTGKPTYMSFKKDEMDKMFGR
jgi:DNA mismatch repair protein MutL